MTVGPYGRIPADKVGRSECAEHVNNELVRVVSTSHLVLGAAGDDSWLDKGEQAGHRSGELWHRGVCDVVVIASLKP